MEYKKFETIAKKLVGKFTDMPKEWDGKEAILAMKEGGSRQWKQMEWIGFYFEFLCEKYLSSEDTDSFMVKDERGSYGKTQFDGFFKIPWDYKAHATNTSSHNVVINDREAIENAIKDYGSVGVIMAIGGVEYNDEDRTFQKWHSELKGGVSEYEKERKKRGAWSRLRKTKFTLQQILFIQITTALLENTGSFQKNFRNADGSPRREKVLLNLEKLSETDYYSIDF